MNTPQTKTDDMEQIADEIRVQGSYGTAQQTQPPQQGEHSPLPWSIREHQRPERETVTYEAGNTFGIYKTNNDSVFWAVADEIESEADARLIVASVNHAAKLAEALRECLPIVESVVLDGEPYFDQQEQARQALAAYEKDIR